MIVSSYNSINPSQLKFLQTIIKPLNLIITASAVLVNPLAAVAEVKSMTPTKYQVAACKSILEHLLLRPESLQVLVYEPSDGYILIDYKAKNMEGNFIQERAFCEITNRATVSIMTAHRRYSSHLNH